MNPVQVARAAGVEELLVVVQVEAVEVRALPAGNLLYPQDFAAPELQRLASAWLDDQLLKNRSSAHRLQPSSRRSSQDAAPRIRGARGALGHRGCSIHLPRSSCRSTRVAVGSAAVGQWSCSSCFPLQGPRAPAREEPCQVRASSPWGPAWSPY